MKDQDQPAHTLRLRAEAMIQEDQTESPDELRRALCELRVHQVELEMQNEELRRVQLELDAARASYFDLYDLAPVGYCTLSKQSLILQVNMTAATLLGVPKFKLISQPLTRFIVKEDQDLFYLYRNQLIKTLKPQACELRMVKNDGVQLWARLETAAIQDSKGETVFRTIFCDISGQRRAEEKQWISDHALGAITQGVLITNADRHIISANAAFMSITGYSSMEIMGNSCGFLQGPLTNPKMVQEIRLALNNITPFSGEILNYRKDGHIFWNELTISPVLDELGQLTHFIGVTRDITKRKQNETKLQASENRYRILLQNAIDATLIADMNGNLEEINHSGELLLGYSRDEIRRMKVADIHPTTELDKIKQCFDGYIKNGSVQPIETKILCKDGRVVDVEVRPTLVEFDGRKVAQGIFIDLTERKLIEKQRLAAENNHRDALIREVHHRIKNNLQGITAILQQFAGNHPETEELLNQVISQMQSIAVIYGLQGLAATSSVRVCELTVAIATGIESLWQKSVTVEIPDGWIPCTISETEAVPLALVLNELISNAVKHGGADGQVHIKFNHEPNPNSIRLAIKNAGLIPVGFGLEAKTGFGTGLQLVISLLPRTGAKLSWAQQDDMVVTTLGLDEPVIKLESPAINKDER